MYSFQSSSPVFDAAQLPAVLSEHQVWFHYLSESTQWALLSVQCEIVDIAVSTQSEENSPKPHNCTFGPKLLITTFRSKT